MDGATVVVEAARRGATLVPIGRFAHMPPVSLDRPLTVIGRGEPVHVRLRSRTISRVHAVCLNVGVRVYLRDLGSRTGLTINGCAVREAWLESGDHIGIGRIVFYFADTTDASAAAAAALETTTSAEPPAELHIAGEPAPRALGAPALLIGRRNAADIALADPSISTAHALLFRIGSSWLVRDLGSRTGTSLNGQPIRQAELTHGAVIQIGPHTMRFRQPAADVEAAAAHLPGVLAGGVSAADAPQQGNPPATGSPDTGIMSIATSRDASNMDGGDAAAQPAVVRACAGEESCLGPADARTEAGPVRAAIPDSRIEPPDGRSDSSGSSATAPAAQTPPAPTSAESTRKRESDQAYADSSERRADEHLEVKAQTEPDDLLDNQLGSVEEPEPFESATRPPTSAGSEQSDAAHVTDHSYRKGDEARVLPAAELVSTVAVETQDAAEKAEAAAQTIAQRPEQHVADAIRDADATPSAEVCAADVLENVKDWGPLAIAFAATQHPEMLGHLTKPRQPEPRSDGRRGGRRRTLVASLILAVVGGGVAATAWLVHRGLL